MALFDFLRTIPNLRVSRESLLAALALSGNFAIFADGTALPAAAKKKTNGFSSEFGGGVDDADF